MQSCGHCAHFVFYSIVHSHKGSDLATSVSAIVLMCYAGRSCGRLQIGMVVAVVRCSAGFCHDQLQIVCTSEDYTHYFSTDK